MCTRFADEVSAVAILMTTCACSLLCCGCAGVYVWGKDWIHAKTQAECYDYLFEAAVKMAQLGINAALPPTPLFASAADNKRPAENGVHTGKQVKTCWAPSGPHQPNAGKLAGTDVSTTNSITSGH